MAILKTSFTMYPSIAQSIPQCSQQDAALVPMAVSK
jgi:hypothetical protein